MITEAPGDAQPPGVSTFCCFPSLQSAAHRRSQCSGLLILDTDLGESPRRERGV